VAGRPDAARAAPTVGLPGPTKGEALPVIEVKLYDKRVTEESVPKMIEALTNALHESSGAAVEHIQVIIEGVSPKHWGIAGKQQG
jgi:4-oxalocrotonate tautomerase